MTSTRTPRTIHTRGIFPARTLHLVDIENLTGNALPCVATVMRTKKTYLDLLGLGDFDQVVIGCSHHAYVDVGVGWGRSARYRVRSGPDGADLELLDTLRTEHVVERFSTVVIASGDGIFAAVAAELAAAGMPVVVVSSREALSPRLALAAHRVVYIEPSEAVVTASQDSAEVAA